MVVHCGGGGGGVDATYLDKLFPLVGQRFGRGRLDLGQLEVDGFPGVVEGRGLKDDPGRPNQNGNSEDPKEESGGSKIR